MLITILASQKLDTKPHYQVACTFGLSLLSIIPHRNDQLIQAVVVILPVDPAPTLYQCLVFEQLRTGPIYGPRRIGPMTGNCLRNPNTTGKKSPKRLMNPNNSTAMPNTGHFRKISTTPPKKHNVPRNLCFRAKKYNVLVGPMINVKPDINRSYD